MKGLTRKRPRAGLHVALTLTLACADAAAAQEICSSVAPCATELAASTAAAAAVKIDELAALRRSTLDAFAGGSRARSHGPLPAGELLWSTAMDRHDLIVGAIDPDHDDGYEYRLPYGDTASYPVIQGYGARLSHRGSEQYTVDFGMAVGTPVHAARDGVVALAEDSHDAGCWREECGRLANFIVLLHADGTTGEYFHLERGSVQVRLGQHVERGALLAFSGNTGYTTAPHLHFGVYRTERDGETQSLAVRFVTRNGMIREPRTGARYLNVAER